MVSRSNPFKSIPAGPPWLMKKHGASEVVEEALVLLIAEVNGKLATS